jgi:hypothetical protein
MENKNNGIAVKFVNPKESKILVNFLRDKGYDYNTDLMEEGVEISEKEPVYLIISVSNKKIMATNLKEIAESFFNEILEYEKDKQLVYSIILGIKEEKEKKHLIRIQLPVNVKENLIARKEIQKYLVLDYRVPADKQHYLYSYKSYLWMIIDHNNKTFWFENAIENTKNANVSFHYRNDRNELLSYIEELTGVERSEIDKKVDEAELKLNEFFQDVSDLVYDIKEEGKEIAGELIEDIKENAKGLAKRTIKNIRETDPVEVKDNLVKKGKKIKEDLTVYTKLIKRKIDKI